MGLMLTSRSGYSRAERISDAAVHLSGLSMALLAVPVLITLAVIWRGDASAVSGVAVYGATLIAMILFSALCNMVAHPTWSMIFRRLDHSAIYWKIAGTFTAFVLISGQGALLLVGIWAAALCGTALRVLAPDRLRWLALGLYLAMGWIGTAVGWPMFASYSAPVLLLMAMGGGLYTIGTGFFLFDRLPFHTTIWHGFVLTATGMFYAAVILRLAETSVT
ncbi:PAQR family membrane homeostasis protein TrhA [Rhodobacter ferrooxidans]|uniref:Hly-III family protein n=1 Tax=Rhodobacter ferrooxidans TaxID=371731 RepID=C8S539_9RHOB|nr:hemolysin III family protein [Rhodobacter sp. SW2]EEW23904.1 Hly-III family protein [Rhodobacter sp. SW2]